MTTPYEATNRLFKSFQEHPLPRVFARDHGYAVVGAGPIPTSASPNLGQVLAKDLDSHFTVVRFAGLVGRGYINPECLLRLLNHLGLGCEECWNQLLALKPTAWQNPVPLDPLARVLRTVTTSHQDRLNPVHRLMIPQAAKSPVAFGRLLLEEGRILAERHPEVALSLVRWSVAQVDFFRSDLVTPDQEDLTALRHLYLAEAHCLAGQYPQASQELTQVTPLIDLGSQGAELMAFWHRTAAGLQWKQKRLRAAEQSFEEALDKLAAPELWERRLEVLIDYGNFQGARYRQSRVIEVLQEARALLEERSTHASPMLRLHTYHNLAVAHFEKWRRLPEAERATAEAEFLPYLDAASGLYERYASADGRADAYMMWGAYEKLRNSARAEEYFVRAATGYVEAGAALEAAQTLFELLEMLPETERGKITTILGQLCDLFNTHPEVRQYFVDLHDTLHANLEPTEDQAITTLARKYQLTIRLLSEVEKPS